MYHANLTNNDRLYDSRNDRQQIKQSKIHAHHLIQSFSPEDKLTPEEINRIGYETIKEFIGVFDFKYFHKTGSDKDITVREIFDTSFYKYKDVYVFRFEANSYLRSQIRLMVGFLLAINDKKLTIDDLKAQLRIEKNIFKTPIIPNGLYLAKIKY